MKIVIFIFTLASALLQVLGSNITIDNWDVPKDGLPLPSRTAAVGDVAIFIWQNGDFHNVYIHPSGTCDTTGEIEVGLISPANYTFTPADGSSTGNPILFACDVGPHCVRGMRMTITVYSTEQDRVNAQAPSSSSSETRRLPSFIFISGIVALREFVFLN